MFQSMVVGIDGWLVWVQNSVWVRGSIEGERCTLGELINQLKQVGSQRKSVHLKGNYRSFVFVIFSSTHGNDWMHGVAFF